MPPAPDSLPPRQDADPNPPVDVAAPPEPPPVDARPPDSVPDAIADMLSPPDLVPTPDVTPPADTGPDGLPACGGFLQPNISKVLNADGLAFGMDGTLYYSTTDTVDGWIGRLLPNGTLDARWAKIEGEPTTWGLAIDNTRNKLYYAGAKSTGTVHVFDLTVPRPTSRLLVANLGQPNDLAVAARRHADLQRDHHAARAADWSGRLANWDRSAPRPLVPAAKAQRGWHSGRATC